VAHELQFYINGAWVDPIEPAALTVLDPSTEEVLSTISLGTGSDVDRAVSAARTAFDGFSKTSKQERIDLLHQVLDAYNRRYDDMACAISQEMGAPLSFARRVQAMVGRAHLEATIAALERFEFSQQRGSSRVVWEPVGVVGLITPWNWPMNQIVCKVAPALAAGCTMVLKPSEIAPLSGIVFAEIMHDAGVPKGVFNLVNGDGPTVGQALASHPDIDMVSFTGSTRAGITVAKLAADTVKRVHQELGGKSANIILADADLEYAVKKGVAKCFSNSGQSCDAPTRMFVPANRHDEAISVARATVGTFKVGDPRAEETTHGPVVSQTQFERIQDYIGIGIAEGADLVAGGLGRPDGLSRGYYVRPTVFGNVQPHMRIAREEIFGPVLSILPYNQPSEAVQMANDTVYGLAAYIQSGNIERAREIASHLRAGSIYINYPEWDTNMPFGGYKQSGNGREYADFGINEFLEIKGIVGYGRQ